MTIQYGWCLWFQHLTRPCILALGRLFVYHCNTGPERRCLQWFFINYCTIIWRASELWTGIQKPVGYEYRIKIKYGFHGFQIWGIRFSDLSCFNLQFYPLSVSPVPVLSSPLHLFLSVDLILFFVDTISWLSVSLFTLLLSS